jgi:hypothetical protein
MTRRRSLWDRIIQRIAPECPPEMSRLDLWDATGRPRDEAMAYLLDEARGATHDESRPPRRVNVRGRDPL